MPFRFRIPSEGLASPFLLGWGLSSGFSGSVGETILFLDQTSLDQVLSCFGFGDPFKARFFSHDEKEDEKWWTKENLLVKHMI